MSAKTAAVVTLTTDFGLTDPFVGIMKGVLLSRSPESAIVDLTHGIAPQRPDLAGFWLARAVPYFPQGTVHVAVVDPGVGTSRRIVAARSRGQRFLAPDNGLLPAVFGTGSADELVEVSGDCIARHGLPGRGRTFDGRDVFAPLAGELASGRLDVADLGPPAGALVPSTASPAHRTDDGVVGEVVVVDHFGNLITNVEAGWLEGRPVRAVIVGRRRLPLVGSYAETLDAPAALVNAHGLIEIAVGNGDAARTLGLGSGAGVRIEHGTRDQGAPRAKG